MAQKWNLQDIRPPETGKDRSRRGVPPQTPRNDIGPRPRPQVSTPPVPDPDLATIDIIDGKSQRRKRIIVSVVVASIIIGAGFLVNLLLSGAEVTVYPKFKDVTVQATFSAYTEPKVDELSYELLTLEASGERQVSASGKEKVSERATGSVFIYNTGGTSSQRLIKNTRFESADGLIFRISESVEVPGATKDAQGNTIPGVVTAEVFADGTGEQYNLPPGRFTVPGLKGSDQFSTIYGESTVGFTGGFEGDKYIIDEGELNTAKQALHIELRNTLLERLKTERPASFILYDDAVTFAFDSLPSTQYSETLATIKERARLQVPLFKAEEFAKYLAKSTIPGYEGDAVAIENPHTLSFGYTNATTTISDIASVQELEFDLKGTARIVWHFDEATLKNQIAGLQKTALPSVLSAYPAISRAESVVRPFWTQSFPEEPDKIVIITLIADKVDNE